MNCSATRHLVVGFAVAAGLLLGRPSVRADSIEGVLSSSPATAVDISQGTADWIHYAERTANVKAGGPKSFGPLTGTSKDGTPGWPQYWGANHGILTPISYADGATIGSREGAEGYLFFETDNVSWTHTLLTPSETIHVYLVAYGRRYRCDLTARLDSGAAHAIRGVTLPTSDGRGHYGGVWTLRVTGRPGDTLTLIMTTTSAAADREGSNLGVEAASAAERPAKELSHDPSSSKERN